MKKSTLCLSFVLVGIGCGSAFASIPDHRMSFADSDELEALVADASATMQQMQGIWTLPCQSWNPSDPTTADDSRSTSWTYTFKGSEFIWETDDFSDKECKQPLGKLISAGFFKVGDAFPGVDGAFNFDMFETHDTHTLLDPTKRLFDSCKGGTNVLSGSSECYPSDTFQIIRVEGERLRFGRINDEHPGSSAITRPSFLSNRIFMRVR